MYVNFHAAICEHYQTFGILPWPSLRIDKINIVFKYLLAFVQTFCRVYFIIIVIRPLYGMCLTNAWTNIKNIFIGNPMLCSD